MAQVELKQVRKTYPNGAEAIFGVDMKIDDGELIVFVGPFRLRQVHLAAHGGGS